MLLIVVQSLGPLAMVPALLLVNSLPDNRDKHVFVLTNGMKADVPLLISCLACFGAIFSLRQYSPQFLGVSLEQRQFPDWKPKLELLEVRVNMMCVANLSEYSNCHVLLIWVCLEKNLKGTTQSL